MRPKIAYLPQQVHAGFPPEWKHFTAAELVENALRLRVANLNEADRKAATTQLLESVGLAAQVDSRPDAFNRGDQRRLALAIELAGDPPLVACDQACGTLDPKAECEFTQLLRTLACERGLSAVQVTHALDNLGSYDSVIVLHGGQLAYSGPPEFLAHYFQIKAVTDLYEHLSTLKPDDCHRAWVKSRSMFQTANPEILSKLGEQERRAFVEKRMATEGRAGQSASDLPAKVPGTFSQFLTLVARRWRLALRNTPALGLQLALLFALPCLAVVFAAGYLGKLQELSELLKGDVADQLKENPLFAYHVTLGVGLIAGLAMLQTIFLGFMAANNAAREIAGERMAFEREKYRGLRPGAYVASKVAFLLPWVLLQAAWMGFYVHSICRLPGNLWIQIAMLALVNGALTALCLAVSSLSRTAWKALLFCFCLAAFQLLLSGTVLSPPEVLSWIVRPLVTLFWGTSAYLQSMQGTRFYDALQGVAPLWTLIPALLCVIILGSQVVLGLLITLFGCKVRRLGSVWNPPGT